MNTKVTICLIGLFFGSSIISCFYSSENCNDILPYFEITGIEASNGRVTGIKNHPGAIIADNEWVEWERLIIGFNFQLDYIAAKTSAYVAILMASDDDCIGDGHMGAKVGVDRLFLRTLEDYNQTYQAGDTINPIVLVASWRAGNTELDSIAQYIALNEERITTEGISFMLSEPPDERIVTRFELTYILKDNTIFRATSPPVTILR